MKSVGRYVHRRTLTQKGREAYLKAMRDCITYTNSGLTNLELVKTKISSLIDEVDHLYPKSMFNSRATERKHYYMALGHALEIVNSLEARFITGAADSEPRPYRNSMDVYFHDEDLF